MDDVEEGTQLIDGEQLPRQGTGQVETETVHVHFLHPVAQAIHDELQDARMLHVQACCRSR